MGQLYYCRGGDAHVSYFADWNKLLSTSSAVEATPVLGTIAGYGTHTGGFITAANSPNSTFWESSGTWDIEINQHTNYPNLEARCKVHRLDSAGNNIQGSAFTAYQALTMDTTKTFTMAGPSPEWTYGEEDAGNLYAIRVEIYNDGPGAATDYAFHLNVREARTPLTEDKRGGIYTDTVTPADSFITAPHFTDIITPTDSIVPVIGVRVTDTITPSDSIVPVIGVRVTDTITPSDSFVTCPHFRDYLYIDDVLEEENYAPLKDPKPPSISPRWKSGHEVTATAYPMGDFGYDATKWRPFPGISGTWWQNLDNDVDLTDTTDRVGSLQGLPPYLPLRLSFSGLPADWGIIEDVVVRWRTTIGAADSGNGTITYSTVIYKSQSVFDSTTYIGGQSTSIDPNGVTNAVYTETFSDVDLTILEFNVITAVFGYLVRDSGGTPVSNPSPWVYAVDIIASRSGDEKVITEDIWPTGKPVSTDFSDTKTITEDVWTKRAPSGSGWEPK